MRIVRFVKHELPYAAGECAGFPDDVAARHIARGVAVEDATPAREPAATPEPEPAPEPTPFTVKPRGKLRRVDVAASIRADSVVSEG